MTDCVDKAARNAAIVAAYLAEVPTKEIAAQHGISSGAVTHIVKRAGIPLRPKGVRAGTRSQLDVAVGQQFGTSIVVEAPRRENDRVLVLVECWSCRQRRDVDVGALRSGKSKLCRRCANMKTLAKRRNPNGWRPKRESGT